MTQAHTDHAQTLADLRTYNEDELFYRSYYEASRDPHTLEAFLDSLDTHELLERKLIVPNLDVGYMPTDITENVYFSLADNDNVALLKHNRFTPPFEHKHRFFEFAYVVEGSCHQWIEGEFVDVPEGGYCIITPGTMHSISVFDDSVVINVLIRSSTFGDYFFNVLREPGFLSAFFNDCLFDTYSRSYLMVDTQQDPWTRGTILSMYEQYQARPVYYDLVLNNSVMLLLAVHMQEFGDTVKLPSRMERADGTALALVTYIENNYRDVSLADVARHFAFSESYCSRLIRKTCGKSFTQLVQQMRFNRARSLLRSTDISVATISNEVGLPNPEHFNRLFKKLYGMTPGQYRTQVRELLADDPAGPVWNAHEN